jgi:hypothetical protein
VSHAVHHLRLLGRLDNQLTSRYAGWIGTVAAGHETIPKPTLEDAASRLAAIAGTSTCHIAQSKEGILVPGVVSVATEQMSTRVSRSGCPLIRSGDPTEMPSSLVYG